MLHKGFNFIPFQVPELNMDPNINGPIHWETIYSHFYFMCCRTVSAAAYLSSACKLVFICCVTSKRFGT